MQPNTAAPREAWLDWLRIISIAGVLFFHSAMPYVPWWWHIKNAATSNILMEINDFLHRCRMPLLFFISGTVSYYMLQKKSGAGFIAIRCRRLLIPLLLAMLVIVPPQVYMERVSQGYTGNFLQFYARMFSTGAYPKGDLSWHHLWFVAYLLVYDILFAPVFVWFNSARGKAFLQRHYWLATRRYIYLLMIPGVLIYTILVMKYPATGDLIHDYAFFPYYLTFVLAGFICIAHPALMDSLERNRRLSFALALLTLIFINYCRWNDADPWGERYAGQPLNMSFAYSYLAIQAISGWMWVFMALGYGKRYLNRQHPVILTYANQAVYPFYILHQTVIVILAYYVVKAPDGVGMKYLFTVGSTFFVSMSIYHLFIQPFPVMRFLFGMKPKPREKPVVKESSTPEIAAPLPATA
ncbi:acyltransferase family protein [Chitinophaga solisilvae]|uniref:acyltransferase family protein n=1 Tax=Chitinophaga solisilvae TaxID=1233460 RepID=UPI0013683971|nr:acyltransferase family protein [Chitinophaga solisilvae]